MAKLSRVIEVDPQKCVNCHACIAACPVKYCNDGTADHVEVDPDLCIGCGSCIAACTHGARRGVDDFPRALAALRSGERMIAISAPAIASNFPGSYLRVQGWLQSLGVRDFFDVSFGAELTVKSYADYIRNAAPGTVIAQPCPAVVSYVELYQPELLPYLAPADSPMLHTVKMIREFYPVYNGYKILVLSPCYAKRREFDETGLGDYNVTFRSLADHIESEGIDLRSYPEIDFVGDAAERAVLFSSPGGLLRTLARDNPEAAGRTRKIEGPETLYDYLKKLPAMINLGYAPLLVDCLNCDMGCNGGPGTLNIEKSIDEIEALVEKRSADMRAAYRKRGLGSSEAAADRRVNRVVAKYWKRGLYGRGYQNLSGNNVVRIPGKAEFEDIYQRMHKRDKKDFLNCGACGYDNCEAMAVAIHNGLNKPSNCFHYERASRLEMTAMLFAGIRESAQRLAEALGRMTAQDRSAGPGETVSIHDIARISGEMRSSIEAGMSYIESTIANMDGIRSSNKVTVEHMGSLNEQIQSITEILGLISAIADQTKIIAFNAELEASAAGETGRSFEIVAAEIRRLANSTVDATARIKQKIEGIQASSLKLGEYSRRESASIHEGSGLTVKLRDVFSHLADYSVESDRKIKSSIDEQVGTFNQTLDELDRIIHELDQYVSR
ncbi:MAG TPA: [Fe-Fe] hydrogenase large subunit C-terminal domain-containing protein [Rectinemataceae bacterium]|nr:[Fe-Fe] hydrogenase large subunit C-terminal domain-containing protein [Rectinemataceae bacterium]